jgi:hypothetical protein
MNEEVKKILLEELKIEGLEIAEDAAIKVFKAIMKAAPKIAAVTDTKADDFLVQLLPFIEPKIIAMLSKISKG